MKKKVLIIQNKFVGDVLASASIANNLKRIHSDYIIHFLCYKPAEAVLLGNPNVDTIITFNDNKLKKFQNLRQLGNEIKNQGYDIVIDPYAKLQSRYLVWASNAPIRISYNKPFFKHLYTHAIAQHPTSTKGFCKALEDRLGLLKPLTPSDCILAYQFKIFLLPEEIEEGRNILDKGGVNANRPTFMLGILGSSPQKSWSINKMASLVQYILSQYDANVLFNYIPNQQAIVDEILHIVNPNQRLFPEIIGKNIREYLKIMANCDAYIGNEGGGLNMAKGLSKPTFSIYSPHKFPEIWGCMEHKDAHAGVHLREVKPELYTKPNLKLLEQNAAEYYDMLPLQIVKDKLNTFIYNNFGLTHNNQPADDNNKISALLICKNEELNIRAWVHEAKRYADEIIIIDSHSTDNTLEILKEYGDVKVYLNPFQNFSNQRNFALSKANHSWVTFFDADERLPIPLISEIKDLVKNEPKFNAYYVGRKVFIKDRQLKYSGFQNDKAIRLFNKNHASYATKFLVHEQLDFDGEIGKLSNKLLHFTYPCFQSYAKKLKFYAELRAEELKNRHIKPNAFHIYVKPAFRFTQHFIVRLGFLDGRNGYRVAKMMAKYVKDRYVLIEKLNEK